MTITLNKNWVFSAFLATTFVLVLLRITPPSVDPVIQITISKNRTAIGNIHQARDVESTRTLMVDRINFYHKGRFSHPKLGNVAIATQNFFIDIDHPIRILKAGQYRFLPGSDDGFSLSINNKKLCEFAADRPYLEQSCTIHLSEGTHRVQFSYFQGGGNSGLTLKYAEGNNKPRWFGDNSKHVRF